MPFYRKRKSRAFTVKAAELAVATPQVVAYRIARMALAGTSPTARDRREFRQMGVEKMAAFAESWNAMAIQTVRANYVLAASFGWAWLAGKRCPSTGSQLHNATLGVLDKGIGPIHRRAVANAKRLARTALR
jgi:hypothetical protein